MDTTKPGGKNVRLKKNGEKREESFCLNCDNSLKITNLLPSAPNMLSSTYTEIHMNYLHLQSSQNLTEIPPQCLNNRSMTGTVISIFGVAVSICLEKDNRIQI